MEALIFLVAVASISVSLWSIFRKERPRTGATVDSATARAAAERLAQALRTRGGDDPAQFGIVLLRDNLWLASRFDGVPLAGRSCEKSARGLFHVHTGRHRVETRVGDRDAVHDFLVRGREVYIRRLDPEQCAFVPVEPAVRARFLELAGFGLDEEGAAMRGALYDYLGVRMQRDWPETAAVLPEVRAGLEQLLARVEAGEPPEDLLPAARALGERLIGLPLGLRALGDLAGLAGGRISGTAAREVVGGKPPRRALGATELALAVLPSEPSLLDLRANLLSDAGRPEDALPVVEEALADLQPGEEEPAKRLRATRAETLARMGRHDEARAELELLLLRYPIDAHVAEVIEQVKRLRTVQDRDS
ncbi:MAG: tetratricopeptide repeat protein [Deltaproteobacteria bacterium]|nr:tetratricopeptide repeat protein [Deltaproteobacteria bacterium]